MTEFLRSRVIIEESDPSIRTIKTLPTAVFGIVGVTVRGPVATPTPVYSYEEFERIYGGFVNGYWSAVAVRAFFDNGGYVCYVSRTVHYSNINARNTATCVTGDVTLQTTGGATSPAEVTGGALGPWTLQPGDTLIGNVGGVGAQTATFNATAASIENDTGESYVLTGEVLSLIIDGGATQTVTFGTATYTAEEAAQLINDSIYGGKAKVTNAGANITIESDTLGLASSVEVLAGGANAILDFDTTAVTGTGNVNNIRAVTLSEAKTVIEAALTNDSGVNVSSSGGGYLKISTINTGGSASIQISASPAQIVFDLDTILHSGATSAPQDTLTLAGKYPGAYVNSLYAVIAAATDGEAGHFNLSIRTATATLETFNNLSMLSTAERYAPSIINSEIVGSIYVTATDEGATGSETVIRPALTSGSIMSGGLDGLVGLVDADYTGSATDETGLYALNEAEDLTILAVPDRNGTSGAVHNAMIAYCEVTRERRVFPILDSPASYTGDQVISYKATLTESESGALYWPRVKILNPSTAVFGTDSQLVVPPSGHIAGVMSRNDSNQKEGPFYQPAGTEGASTLVGVVGLETEEAKRKPILDKVYPKRINPITYNKIDGIYIDGTRTLKGTGNFPSVGERRGVSAIHVDLERGVNWVRHRNNTELLRAEVEREITDYLRKWTARQVFITTDPSRAFYVDVSDALNPPSLQRAGKLRIRIGLATASPIDWVWIDITKDTRAYDEELALAGL